LNRSIHHIRKKLLAKQLFKIDISASELSLLTNQIKNRTAKSDHLEIELILDIILIQLCRKNFNKNDVINLISDKKDKYDLIKFLCNILLLDKDSNAELNSQLIENETIYYFKINTKNNYIFWDVLLPGIYIFHNLGDSILSFLTFFSYHKHKYIFKNYDAISNKVEHLKDIALYSSISNKFLPAEEYILDYSVMQEIDNQNVMEQNDSILKAKSHHLDQYLLCFNDRTLLVKEFYKTIKNNNEISDCLKAEILLGLAGKKVSRLTIPKILADDLHWLWSGVSSLCCASSFLVKTKNEGIGTFSNTPQGFVSYAMDKNLRSHDLIFIYIAESQNKAVECARLDANDDAGEILGIPNCCVDFYKKSTQTGRHINPFFISAESKQSLTIPWQLNFYAMYQGTGLLWHFPCSQNCSATIRVVNDRYDFINSIDPSFAEKLKLAQLLPVYFKKGEYQNIADDIAEENHFKLNCK
jgi:hypothetical protein